MPVLFTAVFSLMYLTFYVHNHAALTANAAETAVSGIEREVPSYMASGGARLSLSRTKKKRSVSYEDQLLHYSGVIFGELSGTLTYETCDPTGVLRCRQSFREN